MKKISWEEAANYCERIYGIYVSREEDDEFFICPECDEPILKEDWDNFNECPVCEFQWFEDEVEEW